MYMYMEVKPTHEIFDLILICGNFCRLSKSGGGVSGDEPSFAEAMAEEYRKYQEEHGITDDELEEFGECAR